MKLFKDLPNTDTPINAENLNQIQDNLVVVSPTEPTGDNREKVWIQKGKNLFNVNQLNVLAVNNASYSKQNNEIIVTSNGTYSRIDLLVKLEVGKTYFLSANVINSIIGQANISIYSLDYTKKYVEQNMKDDNGTIGLLFTPEEENIIILLYSNATSNGNTNTANFSNIQLEQGSTATPYEAYIEPEIYILNDNGVYEKFISKENLVNYSTGEQRIGTWINGKPLYEKVIDGITPNTTTDTKVFDIPNIATLVNIKGIIANWLPINSIVSPENSSILYFQADGFMMAIGSSQMNKPFRAIVEYTKTTD